MRGLRVSGFPCMWVDSVGCLAWLPLHQTAHPTNVFNASPGTVAHSRGMRSPRRPESTPRSTQFVHDSFCALLRFAGYRVGITGSPSTGNANPSRWHSQLLIVTLHQQTIIINIHSVSSCKSMPSTIRSMGIISQPSPKTAPTNVWTQPTIPSNPMSRAGAPVLLQQQWNSVDAPITS